MSPGFGLAAGALLLAGASAHAQNASTQLPAASGDPLQLDLAGDPILQLARSQASEAEFRSVVAAAVARHPAVEEGLALRDEAEAMRDEARERQFPSVDLSLTSYRVLAREFSNDPNNIIERSRARQRTDALGSVQQTVLDFGANRNRIAAAGARIRAAMADLETSADRTALAAVAAWYDVFAYRALAAVAEAFIENQGDLRSAVQERIAAGASAPGDMSRVDSYVASAQTRLAVYRRLVANAEARYTELVGSPPPEDLERAPPPNLEPSREQALEAAVMSPAARSARALAAASKQEAKAAKAERLPAITAGVDAGRYGVFETERDYDVRGRVTLRQRFFGGIEPRVRQVEARARAAEARARRVEEEGARDAAIAWSDVQALEQQVAALEASYVASRRSRDVLAERFRAARGSLFDLVAAEDIYFEAAGAYIQALAELDSARYVLLSRTGNLLSALDITPTELKDAR